MTKLNTCKISVEEGCDIVMAVLKEHGGAAAIGEIKNWVRNNYPDFDMSGTKTSEWYRLRWCLQELKIGTTSDRVKVKTLLTSSSQPDGKWRIAEETALARPESMSLDIFLTERKAFLSETVYKWFKRYSSYA
jgi:hypothetical protein